MKKQNSFLRILCWIVGLTLSYAITQTLYQAGQSKSRLNANLIRVAKDINDKLPMMVDSETRLEKVTSGSGKLTFYLTLPNISKDEVDLTSFKTNMLWNLVENYKTNSTQSQFRENNVILDYQYNDKSGNLILQVSVSPKDF